MLQGEWPQLRALAAYAQEHGPSDVALSLASAVHGFLRTQGHWCADLELQHAAVRAADGAADQRAAAAALVDLADAQYMLDQYPAALASLDRALGLYDGLGDRRGRADARTVQGDVQRQTGEREKAERNVDEAISLYRSIDDRTGQVTAKTYLGVVYLQGGALAEAKRMLREATALFEASRCTTRSGTAWELPER